MASSQILHRFLRSGVSRPARLLSLDARTAPCYPGRPGVCRTYPPPRGHSPGVRCLSSPGGATPQTDGQIWSSPYADVVIPDLSLSHYVMQNFLQYGGRPALINGITGQSYTFAELQDKIVKVASYLVKQGYKKGDLVTMFTSNCPEFAILYLAWISFGGVVSAVNPLYTHIELEHALQDSEAKMVVTIPQLLPVVKQAQLTCPQLKSIVVFGEAESGSQPFSSMLEDDGKAFPDNLDIDVYDDVAALPYSSGTTGIPKGVMLTHRNIVANIQQSSAPSCLRYTNDVLLGVLPMFHIYGQVPILLSSLQQGSTLVTLPSFTPETFLNTMQSQKVTLLHLAPPIVLFLAKHPLVSDYDFSRVRRSMSGAAPLGRDVVDEACERIKCKEFIQGYGLTETGPVAHLLPWQSEKIYSIGVSIPNTEYYIRDLDTGRPLPPGQEGEVMIRGPQVMKGYFKRDEATTATMTDDWLHTGDIGYTDEEGFVTISDRLKELIKHKGFQVAPAELEHLLLSHPSIQDCAVIGIPDDRAGELPRGYVKVKPTTSITEHQIHDFLKDKVAVYKQLTGGVEFIEEIPKSASGKILRRILKETYLNKQ